MNATTWKTLAIIFFILFLLETFWIGYSTYLVYEEIDKTNTCFYDICSEYPDAYYLNDICTCYDYDMFGEYIVAKEVYMKE
jgi:hypothetical protein